MYIPLQLSWNSDSLFDQVNKTFFADAGVGFFAELTEQNHETSHGAGGDREL